MESTVIDADKLQAIFKTIGISPDWLNGVQETGQEWRLGKIAISKTSPVFQIGWSIGLSKTSRFRKEPFAVDGRELVAAVFHQFDDGEYGKPASELVAGWVEKERESELDAWIEFMNREVEGRLRNRKP